MYVIFKLLTSYHTSYPLVLCSLKKKSFFCSQTLCWDRGCYNNYVPEIVSLAFWARYPSTSILWTERERLQGGPYWEEASTGKDKIKAEKQHQPGEGSAGEDSEPWEQKQPTHP